MKKAWFRMGLAIILSFTLLLTACSGANTASTGAGASSKGSDGKVYELNFNISAGATHPYITTLAQPWADYVDQKTNGRVKIHIFPSAALGSLSTAYEDMKGGVYDLGLIVADLFQDTDLYPMSIADLPFAINDPIVATKVMTKFKDKYMKNVFGKEITFLSTSSTDAYQLFSKAPIEKLDDVKKKKIASSLQSRLKIIDGWGAVPVSLMNTEYYESLEKGIVDSAVYTAVGANSFKFYELTPYMTKVDFGAASQLLAMNTAALESMPEDIQKMFMEDFGPRFAQKMAEMYKGNSDKAVQDFTQAVKSKGGRVIAPTPEEMQKFRAAAKPYYDGWVEGAKKRGYPGDEMMKDFLGWMEEAGAKITF